VVMTMHLRANTVVKTAYGNTGGFEVNVGVRVGLDLVHCCL